MILFWILAVTVTASAYVILMNKPGDSTTSSSVCNHIITYKPLPISQKHRSTMTVSVNFSNRMSALYLKWCPLCSIKQQKFILIGKMESIFAHGRQESNAQINYIIRGRSDYQTQLTTRHSTTYIGTISPTLTTPTIPKLANFSIEVFFNLAYILQNSGHPQNMYRN